MNMPATKATPRCAITSKQTALNARIRHLRRPPVRVAVVRAAAAVKAVVAHVVVLVAAVSADQSVASLLPRNKRTDGTDDSIPKGSGQIGLTLFSFLTQWQKLLNESLRPKFVKSFWRGVRLEITG